MKILDTSREGFQAAEDIFAPKCTRHPSPNIPNDKIFNNDKIFWLCETDGDAQQQTRILISTGDVYSGVCYATTSGGFYTCYTRPTQKTYLANEGVFVKDDPSSDGMPMGIESDITNICGDFGATMNTIQTVYVSTVSIGGAIQSTINTITKATTSLIDISTIFCDSNKVLSDADKYTCNTLSTGINIFKFLPSGGGPGGGLITMSTTVYVAVSSMSNLYTNQLQKTYKGFGYSTCNFSTFTDFI